MGLDFHPIELADKARKTFGLRRQDYAKYMSHCSHKLRKLRSSLKIKPNSGSQGRSALDSKPQYLELFLFETEKAWSYANELKAKKAEDDNALSQRHCNKTWRRAAHFAERLWEQYTQTFQKEGLQDVYRAEVAAYCLSTKATSFFETSRWEVSLQHLSVAYELLGLLASASGSQDSAIFAEWADELEPMIRYCVRKIDPQGRESDGSVSDNVARCMQDEDATLSEEKALAKGLKVSLPSDGARDQVTVEWLGSRLPVRQSELLAATEKIGAALKQFEDPAKLSLRILKPNFRLSAKQMKRFDEAIGVLAEAEETSRTLLADNELALQKGHTVRYETISSSLRQLHNYYSYHLLLLRAARDLALSQTHLSRAARVTDSFQSNMPSRAQRKRAKTYAISLRLYDAIIQAFEEMLVLVENDLDHSSSIESHLSAMRARKSALLARLYQVLQLWPSGVALTSHAAVQARQSHSADSSVGLLSIFADSATDLSEESLREEWLERAVLWHSERSLEKPLTPQAGAEPVLIPSFDIAFNFAAGLATEEPSLGEARDEMPETAKSQEKGPTEDLKPTPAPTRRGIWGLFTGQ